MPKCGTECRTILKWQACVELLSTGSAYRRAPPFCTGFHTKWGIKSLKQELWGQWMYQLFWLRRCKQAKWGGDVGASHRTMAIAMQLPSIQFWSFPVKSLCSSKYSLSLLLYLYLTTTGNAEKKSFSAGRRLKAFGRRWQHSLHMQLQNAIIAKWGQALTQALALPFTYKMSHLSKGVFSPKNRGCPEATD